jgi:hypothetical protein
VEPSDADHLWTSRIGGAWAAGIFAACLAWSPFLGNPSFAAPLAVATLVAGAPGLAAATFIGARHRSSIRLHLGLWCLLAPIAVLATVLVLVLAIGMNDSQASAAALWALQCAAAASAVFYAWTRIDEKRRPPPPDARERVLVSVNRLLLLAFFLAAAVAAIGEGSTNFTTATFGFYYITCLMPAFAAGWLLLLIYASGRRVPAAFLFAPAGGAMLLLGGYANINP